MELFVISIIASIILKLLLLCKWSFIISLSVVVGVTLTLISCLIPVESHTIYQRGLRGSDKLLQTKISHTPNWQNSMLLSFFLIPTGSLIGYAIYMWVYILHCIV